MLVKEDIEEGMASVWFDFETESRFTPRGKIAFPSSLHTLSELWALICVNLSFLKHDGSEYLQ